METIDDYSTGSSSLVTSNFAPATHQEVAAVNERAAWHLRAAELADWTLPLVARSDCHGAHDGRSISGRTTCKSPLTREALEKHFAATAGSEVLGIHVSSSDEQCVLVVVDIDAHGNPGDDPEKNQAFAHHIYLQARAFGFAALLLASNGRGGFHVWVMLGRRTPMAQAWGLGKLLTREFESFGLLEQPESFPKRPYLTGKRFGNWVRIFGLHHKRPFWTKVWDEKEGCWRDGAAAIELILDTKPVPVDVSDVLPAEPHVAERSDVVPTTQCLAYGHRRKVRLTEEAMQWLRGGEVDCYDDWLTIGMCLSELNDDGLRIWDAWSRQSAKYHLGQTREKWQSFQAGNRDDPRTVGLGSLFQWAETYGFKRHKAGRRWADYQKFGHCVLDEGEDAEHLADDARDQKYSLLCDDAVATLESRPDLRAQLAEAWGVSERTTRLIGVGLREDRELWLDRWMNTGRWAVTVPLTADGVLTVGYVRLYPGEAWKSRLGWGSRPGLIIPWDLETRDGPIIVCRDPADTAHALELGGCAVGLSEPGAPLEELVACLDRSREIVVAPRADGWADDTAYRLGKLTGCTVKVLDLHNKSLRECLLKGQAGGQ